MIAIPNMEKPKSCMECPFEVIYTSGYPRCVIVQEMVVDGNLFNRCPLIDIARCEECKWCDDKGRGRALICTNPYIDMDIHPLDFCSKGERRADEGITE